jgi:putative spermidine/putrescine transport system permease protein
VEQAVTRGAVLRTLLLATVGLYFAVPMLAMARFAFQRIPIALLTPDRLLEGWSLKGLFDALSEDGLQHSAWISFQLAFLAVLVNLALLVPLAIAVELYFPRAKGPLTMITLLPWVIPPIALVVGIAATFRTLAPWFLASPLSLVPFYALTAMPFTYRALDAGLQSIGARTLNEAARSLGARTSTILFRVLIPNLSASLIASSVLTVALVLGEFTFAALLLKDTLPTYMVNYQRGAARAGIALALAVMVLTSILLWFVVRLLRRRGLDAQMTGVV